MPNWSSSIDRTCFVLSTGAQVFRMIFLAYECFSENRYCEIASLEFRRNRIERIRSRIIDDIIEFRLRGQVLECARSHRTHFWNRYGYIYIFWHVVTSFTICLQDDNYDNAIHPYPYYTFCQSINVRAGHGVWFRDVDVTRYNSSNCVSCNKHSCARIRFQLDQNENVWIEIHRQLEIVNCNRIR